MKKIVTLAAIAALALPALANADTANANVYGTINTSIEAVSADGNTVGEGYNNHLRYQSNSSNIGVKGSEDIGATLKAIYQVELDVRAPEAALSATLRNSMVGFEGVCGKVFVGKWDTPFKNATAFMDPFYNTGVGYMASLIDTSGGAAATSFNLRQANSIQYWTPVMAGAQLQLVYSPRAAAALSTDSLMGGTLSYTAGGLNAAFAYEVHNDYSAVGTKDTGMKAAVGYKLMENTSLNVAYGTLNYVTVATDAGNKRATTMFTVLHKMGDFTIRGGYAMAGKFANSVTGDIADTGANEMVIGGSYSLSKRTDLYAVYAKISNDPAATYNFAVSPVNAGTAVASAAGSDPTSFGLGVRHAF